MVRGEAQNVQSHYGIHHGRINRPQPVGMGQPFHHPPLGAPDGLAAQARRTVPLPPLEPAVQGQKSIAPREPRGVPLEFQTRAGQPDLFESEALRNRTPRVGRMHNGERNRNRARPRGHLIRQPERQHSRFRRNRGTIAARIKVEETQVDFDVAVRRLNATEFQNALPQPRHGRVFPRQTAQLQRGIRLYRRADLRRSAFVDVEAAIGKLAFEDRSHGFIDSGRVSGRQRPSSGG